MLRRLRATGFKSLVDVDLEMRPVTVLFGPNGAGKSNVLDALQALSRIATERTLKDALAPPIRGYASEVFTMPAGGLAALLNQKTAEFRLSADIVARGAKGHSSFRYDIDVGIAPASGSLTTVDERLTRLKADGKPTGNARIERLDRDQFVVRANRQGHPRHVPTPLNHALLSDPTLTSPYYHDIDVVREELTSWRTYFLEPAVAMRSPSPPSVVQDIGSRGENLAPFLHHLQQEHPERYKAVVRAVRQVVPSIERIDVELDVHRGTLDLVVHDGHIPYSSRVISEGTLRILALASIAVNPYPAGLIAFEEPENGVHPRRVATIARFLLNTAQRSQVVVTSHSPTFLGEMLRLGREQDDATIGLFACRHGIGGTEITPFQDPGPLFEETNVAEALAASGEDRLVEEMYLRGWLDA